MYRLSLISFLFISFVNSNELTFNEVIEKDDKSVEISFLLEKVTLVKSYSLNNPSRLVLDIYDTKLKEDINISYNYPIKKIRSISEGDTSRIVIDLYENIFWEKPTQVQTKNGVMLTLVTKRIKNLENSIRDIVIAIDAGHGGKYPGAVGPNNILESLSDGIYATGFSGGQVDITNGKFVFSCTEAYRVVNGKVREPLTGATLIGDGATALTKIRAVGNDLSLDPGIGNCGKAGQWVPVGVGQPTLFISGLTIGGSQTN